jgi:hypothetical protein
MERGDLKVDGEYFIKIKPKSVEKGERESTLG